jgi:arabinose-5-phosphate isomerase
MYPPLGPTLMIKQFLLETIRAERDAIAAMESMVDERWVEAVEIFDAVRKANGRVIICGVGKSGHVGKKIAASLASTGTPSFFVHGTEASHGDLGMIMRGDAVIMITASGGTSELVDAASYCRDNGIPLVVITRNPDSRIGRYASIVLPLPPVPEACPNGQAPTTSSTATLVVGDAITIALMRLASFSKSDFGRYHPGGKLGDATRRLGDVMVPVSSMKPVPPRSTFADAIRLAQGGAPLAVGAVGIDESALITMMKEADNLDASIDQQLKSAPVGSTIMLMSEAKAMAGAGDLGVSIVDNGKLVGYVSARSFR